MAWAGFRPPEFGTYPVHLRFSLDSYQGPSWVVPAIRNRSGWLGAAEVEMETEFDCTREILYGCVAEDGEVLGNWVAEALFSMACGLPTEVEEEAPDDLEVALDAAYWDFLGRCDLMHLRMLEEKEREIAAAIGRLETRQREVYAKVDDFLTSLMARRRRERDNHELRLAVDAKVEEIDRKQAEANAWHRGKVEALKSDMASFEDQVMRSLGNHGSISRLHTIHWATPSDSVRRLSRDDVSGYARPQPVRDSSWEPSSYYTPHLVSRSAIKIVKGNSASWKRQREIELDEKQRLVEAAAARELAQLAPGSVKRGRPIVPYFSEGVDRENSHAKVTGPPNHALEHANQPEELGSMALDGSLEFVAVIDDEAPLTENAPRQQDTLDPIEQELVEALELQFSSVRDGEGRSAESVGDEDVGVVPSPEIDLIVEMPTPRTPRAAVVVSGDRVLLRLEDGGGPLGRHARYLQYTIVGAENDPLRGILALSDDRAKAILGRNVGDRVCLEIAGRERFALIEKIMNFDQDASA